MQAFPVPVQRMPVNPLGAFKPVGAPAGMAMASAGVPQMHPARAAAIGGPAPATSQPRLMTGFSRSMAPRQLRETPATAMYDMTHAAMPGMEVAMAPSVVIPPTAAKKRRNRPKQMLAAKEVCLRQAAGKTWVDKSMDDWQKDDFRIFVGDLGNEVSDATLTAAFAKYSSFQRARVVRDKRNGKSKGYGFVSMMDASEYLLAMKEMDRKYVGSRPIKLRRSKWKDRKSGTFLDPQKLDAKRKTRYSGRNLKNKNVKHLEGFTKSERGVAKRFKRPS